MKILSPILTSPPFELVQSNAGAPNVYCSVAAQHHTPGSLVGQNHTPGSVKAQDHTPGSVVGGYC